MRRLKKAAAVLVLAAVLALTGCVRDSGNELTAERAETLVRNNLELIYRGTCSEEFLEEVGYNEETAKASYENNMEVEANYILYYYRAVTYGHSSGNSYTLLSSEHRQAAIDLCKEIYAKVRYTVGRAEEQEDGSFAVSVQYSPLDLHELVDKEWVEFETGFVKRYDDVKKSEMSDSEYNEWLEKEVFPAYNQAVLDLLRSKLADAGYGEQATAAIKVTKGDDDSYAIDFTSFDAFDRLLVPVATVKEPETTPTATGEPSAAPTGGPTEAPSAEPSGEPTAQPTAEPTATPTPAPTSIPAPETLHHVELTVKDYGTIKLELDETAAPKTVANFLKLVKEGFYDGLTFHRIKAGFVIQGGDPEGTGFGGSKDTVEGEFASNGWKNPISHTRGVISMARADDPNSASSQFFIVHQDSTFLDGKYAAFGRVTEGMEVVDAIAADAKPTDDNGTIPADAQPVITSITVVD